MTQRTQFQAQILEKLGSPLIAAAGGLTPEGGQKLAETLAALIGLSAQTAVAIGKSLQLGDDDPQAEPVRLALMAVSGRLLADQARLTKQTPGTAENQALTTALDNILKFSESFVDAGARLGTLDGQAPDADATQRRLQTLFALTPLINVVVAAPLGQAPDELLKSLNARILTRAQEMRATLGLAAATDGEQIELQLLRSLITLYTACHEEARTMGGATAESVWHAFATRATILEILGGNIGPVTAGAQTETPALAMPAATPTLVESAPAAAAASEPAPSKSGDGGANPMAFFKPGAKKPAAADKPDDTPTDGSAG